MYIVHTIQDIRKLVSVWKAEGLTIGFVPTMGYLHEGHAALLQQARQENDRVVLSIFVNPSQFGPQEDLDSYPRDIKADTKLASANGVDAMFVPTVDELYVDPKTSVHIQDLSATLCGVSRPIHFTGVCTVVTKLFNIINPDRAYFGEKDAQQLAIIRKLVVDLNIPVDIVGVPIVREPDGLARSSRNTYLSPDERKAATVLYKAILEGKRMVEAQRDASVLIAAMTHIIDEEPLARIDYISIVDQYTMQPVEQVEGAVLVAMAVYIGHTRLIDNFSYDPS